MDLSDMKMEHASKAFKQLRKGTQGVLGLKFPISRFLYATYSTYSSATWSQIYLEKSEEATWFHNFANRLWLEIFEWKWSMDTSQ